MKIKTGDNVIVISGREKGKRGKITKVFPDIDKVLVEGLNLKKKYQKNRDSKKENQVLDVEYPIHVSNVALVDEKSGKPSKIGIKVDEKGKKIRILKRSGEEIK